MIRPFKIVEESDTETTYQYNSYYSWVLLSLLALMAAGVATHNSILQIITGICFFAYFGLKVVLGRKPMKDIKSTLKSGSVEMSGGKYSISKPLTIRVKRDV